MCLGVPQWKSCLLDTSRCYQLLWIPAWKLNTKSCHSPGINFSNLCPSLNSNHMYALEDFIMLGCMIVHLWTKYCCVSLVLYTFVLHTKYKMHIVMSNEDLPGLGMKLVSATVLVDFYVNWMSRKGNSSIQFSISKSTQEFGKLFYDISTEMKDTWSFHCLCFSITKYITIIFTFALTDTDSFSFHCCSI